MQSSKIVHDFCTTIMKNGFAVLDLLTDACAKTILAEFTNAFTLQVLKTKLIYCCRIPSVNLMKINHKFS